jgi:hypothetical protein
MKENAGLIFLIEPQRGLGMFKLDSNVNYVMSDIRSRGEKFEKVDLLIGDTGNEPIFLSLKSEGVRLRFDQFYQRLELIEIDVKSESRRIPIVYKRENMVVALNNESQLTYNTILNIFGPSSMPRLIDSNKYLLLRYSGISFIFDFASTEDIPVCITSSYLSEENTNNNNNIVNSNLGNIQYNGSNLNLSAISDLPLLKISLFTEHFLINSIGRDNSLFKHPCPLIKVDLDKGICLVFNPEIDNLSSCDEVYISFGDSLESILYALKNPNFIHYKQSREDSDWESELYMFDNDKKEDSDFFLNYYSLGLDILIDSKSKRAKRFILHTNNPYDLKFGIYNKSNFIIEFHKTFLKK